MTASECNLKELEVESRRCRVDQAAAVLKVVLRSLLVVMNEGMSMSRR